MMNDVLTDKVVDFTHKNALLSLPSTVIVGVSGGADSMALLHALHTWPEEGLRVFAVHVHHGLRGREADRDEALVRDYCAANDIPLEIVHADVRAFASQKRCGLEEAGRQVRYAAFEELRERYGGDYIATAHTASDAVETMLMHLVRGTGVSGLVGIPAKRGCVVRPLLSCSRQEVEDYCAAKGIPYITDSTNADTTFMRNRIRHELLPALRALNPSIDSALLRLRDSAVKDETVWQRMAEQALVVDRADNSVDCASFSQQPLSVRVRMWKRLLAQCGCYSFTEKHIDALEVALCANRGTVYLPDGYFVMVSSNRIRCFDKPLEQESGTIAVPPLPAMVDFSGHKHALRVLSRDEMTVFQNVHKKFFKFSIDCDRIQGSLYLRCRRDGDVFHPSDRRVGKTLKKLYQELRIPVYYRDTYPLLCDDAGVLLIPGIGCDSRACPDDSTKHFLVWLINGEPSYTWHCFMGGALEGRDTTESKE